MGKSAQRAHDIARPHSIKELLKFEKRPRNLFSLPSLLSSFTLLFVW